MFEKVLVVSEIQPHFEKVLDCVASLSQTGTRSCLLLQCLNPQELNETLSTYITGIYRDSLDWQKRHLEEKGLQVSIKETIGVFRDSISRVADQEGCSLIIAGAPERSRLGSLLDGGAAYHIMHGATRPLLLIRLPDHAEPAPAEAADCDLARHILFPTDFSENARLAFQTVKEAVQAGVRQVTLLHVQDKSRLEPHLLDRLDAFNRTDTERLQHMAGELQQAGQAEIAIRLVYGSPTTEILRVIAEDQISLVVMGSQGRGWIREIYLGSVSHNIARHSPASVLLIPLPRA